MRSRVLVTLALSTVAAVVAPASAQACTRAVLNAQVVAPAELTSFEQTRAGVPVQVRFPGSDGVNRTASYGIARLHTPTLPPLGAGLPADVGTTVETGQLTYDAATGTWSAATNTTAWAQTPGEYVWQATLNTHIPASPPPVPDANGQISGSTCDSPNAWTLVSDGNWTHRFTVLGTSGVTAKAAKARDGRAKVSGSIAKTFPGKVRLTVACSGKRARTTFVPVKDGKWNRNVNAKRGCRIEASVAARAGWAASTASARVS